MYQSVSLNWFRAGWPVLKVHDKQQGGSLVQQSNFLSRKVQAPKRTWIARQCVHHGLQVKAVTSRGHVEAALTGRVGELSIRIEKEACLVCSVVCCWLRRKRTHMSSGRSREKRRGHLPYIVIGGMDTVFVERANMWLVGRAGQNASVAASMIVCVCPFISSFSPYTVDELLNLVGGEANLVAKHNVVAWTCCTLKTSL